MVAGVLNHIAHNHASRSSHHPQGRYDSDPRPAAASAPNRPRSSLDLYGRRRDGEVFTGDKDCINDQIDRVINDEIAAADWPGRLCHRAVGNWYGPPPST